MSSAVALREIREHRENYTLKRVNVFNVQTSSCEANDRDLDLLIRFMTEYGHDELTGPVVMDFLSWLRQERGNNPGSTNRKISSLRTYLKWLEFFGVKGAADFPTEAIPRVHQPYPGPVRTATPEEMKRLLGMIDAGSVLGIRDRLLYGLLYALGLRIGEALAMDLDDVDLVAGTIHVRGKGRRNRTLCMPDGLPALFLDWLSVRGQVKGAADSQAMFLSKKGNTLAHRTAQDNLQKLVVRMGPLSIDRLTPHSLRHAFATHALTNTRDIIILMAILGHSKMDSTALYLHPSMRQMRAATNNHIAADIIGDILSKGAFPMRMHQVRGP